MSDQCFCLRIYIYLSYSHRVVHNAVSVAVIAGVYVHVVVGEKKRERESFRWAPTVDIPLKRRHLISLPVFVVTSNAPSTFEAHVHAHNLVQRDEHLFFHPICISPLLPSVFVFPLLKPAETTRTRRRVINKKQKQMLVHPCNCAAFPSCKAANYLFFDSVSSNICLLALFHFF